MAGTCWIRPVWRSSPSEAGRQPEERETWFTICSCILQSLSIHSICRIWYPMSVDRITDQEITSSSPTSSLFLNSNTGKRLVIDGALFSGCQKSPLGDFFDSLHPVPFPPSPGRKSPRFARRSPCRARTAGDVIPFEAGCRPLELPCTSVARLPSHGSFSTSWRPVIDGAFFYAGNEWSGD